MCKIVRFTDLASGFQCVILQIILFIFLFEENPCICACVCVYMYENAFINLYFYNIHI